MDAQVVDIDQRLRVIVAKSPAAALERLEVMEFGFLMPSELPEQMAQVVDRDQRFLMLVAQDAPATLQRELSYHIVPLRCS